MTTILTSGPTAQTEAPGPNHEAASKLYPERAAVRPEAPPAAVAAVRTADGAARVLYPPERQYGPALRQLALATNPAGTEAALERQCVELANCAADAGLDASDLQQFAAFALANAEKPPTAAQRAASEKTSVKALRDQYGSNFTTALRAGQALAQRDGRFAAYLDRTGLAVHPHVALRLAEVGLSQLSRGRLTLLPEPTT